MTMEVLNGYSNYTAQNMAGSKKAEDTKKKGTEKTAERQGSSKAENTADYMSKLEKLAPSVEFSIGNTHSSAKSGKTLTINPELLKKMQENPDKEKEMKELIRGVESATKLLDSMHRASGWTVVYRHGYIDENGKYSSCAYVRNDFMLNMSDKLREERKENSEKLLEKSKEKLAKKREELKEALEAKRTEEGTKKAKEMIDEKIADSKDGRIYLYDTDMKILVKAAKGDKEGKTGEKEQVQAGANLDLKV